MSERKGPWRLASALLLLAGLPASAETVVGSLHDLSMPSVPKTCEFCHAPHRASLDPVPAPLWSRQDATEHFPLYSPAASADGAVPPGAYSRLCVSCHDGVHARGLPHASFSGPRPDPRNSRGPVAPRSEHPVGMPIPTNLQDPAFRTAPDPVNGWVDTEHDNVRLFRGAVECGSCHNAHNPRIQPFLRTSNTGQGLCLKCHVK